MVLRIRAPGRITLFGEHQDYLGFPIIAMALSKYIYLEAERIEDSKFIINLPDINDSMEIHLNNKELEYESKRDYLRSGYNQFIRRHIKFDKGYKIKMTGDIPINAGAASSSAFVIVWLFFLNFISNANISKNQLANLGYITEVAEFGEAGGKMDFFSSIYGNLIYLESNELNLNVVEIPLKLDGFVLGNSLEKKNTVEDLRRVKYFSIQAFQKLKEIMPNFNMFTSSLEQIDSFLENLEEKYQQKIIGNIINRDLTYKAKNLLLSKFLKELKTASSKESLNLYHQLGDLINLHHIQLKNRIEVSTYKIENMISASLDAGALGAKINGSGFGGTMFALAPGNEIDVKTAIENVGGEAFIIRTSDGVGVY